MQHRARLTYTEQLIARAVFAFWRRSIGIGLGVAVATMLGLLVWSVSEGDRSWLVGLMAATVLLGIFLPLLVYVIHHRNSISKFRDMAEPIAEFIAEEDEFTLASSRGTTTLKWAAVTEVWRFESFWLLLFSKAQFVTLPLDGLSEQMRIFVLEKIRACGGKIAV